MPHELHSGFLLVDGNYIDLEETLGADDTFTGITCYGQAYEELAQWDVCYRNAAGKWGKAMATATTTMPAIVMATAAINADAYGIFLLYGFVRNDGWAAWTVGHTTGLLYVSRATAGLMTQTLPAVAGEQVQIVGSAIAAQIILFNPSYELVEIA